MSRRTSRTSIRARIAALVMVVAAVVAITTGVVAAASTAPTRDAAGTGGVVASTDPAVTSVTVEHDVVWRTVDGEVLTLDAYYPTVGSSTADRAAVVLVHGGGWSGGDKSNLAEQARALAEAGYVAVTVDYRLAPAHPYPAAVEDVQAAVSWLRATAQVDHYRIDPERIGVLGASAGGQLAELLGTLGRGSLESGTRVAAVVSWSGVADLTSVDLDPGVLGCATSDCPEVAAEASPVTHVDATDSPMLLVTSQDDLIVPRSQAEEMAATLDAAGVAHQLVVVDGAAHAQQLASSAWDATLAFLDAHLRAGLDGARTPGA
jgi:acetyl esterase/lipase